jgi:hypothetical protein
MRGHMKLMIFSGLLCAFAVLSACGPLPKPFKRSDAPPDILTSAKGNIGVQVGLPEGTTKPMANLIAQSVVNALTAREIPAKIGVSGKLRYTLLGAVVTGAGSGAAPPTRIRWQLMENGSELFFSFDHDVQGSAWEWQWGSPKILQEIGDAAGRLIVEAIDPEDSTLKPAQGIARGVWVEPISGAPGDGDISLTRAMRFALMGAKVAVTSEAVVARHYLQGKVLLTPPEGKSQTVEIKWTVTYPDGAIVGHAVQRNVVPAGMFDGRWGESASIIAAAAVDGVKNVLDRAEETVRVRISGGKRNFRADVPHDESAPKLPPPELSPEPELLNNPKTIPQNRKRSSG